MKPEDKIFYVQSYSKLQLFELLNICKTFEIRWNSKNLNIEGQEIFSCLLIVMAEKYNEDKQYDKAIKMLDACLLVQNHLGDIQNLITTKFEIAKNYYAIYKNTKKFEDIEKVYELVHTAKEEIYQQLRKAVTEAYEEALKIWVEKLDANKARGFLGLVCEKYLIAEDRKGAGIIANVIAYNYHRQYQMNMQDAYYVEQAIRWIMDAMKYDPKNQNYKNFYDTLKIEYADFLFASKNENKRERQENEVYDATNPYNNFNNKRITLEKNVETQEHKSFQK